MPGWRRELVSFREGRKQQGIIEEYETRPAQQEEMLEDLRKARTEVYQDELGANRMSSAVSLSLSSNQENLRTLLKGSGIVAIGMVIRVLLVFVTEVLVARILLPERYGLLTWGLFVVNILCMLSSLGINTAVRRFLPIYQSAGDDEAVRGLVLLSGFVSMAGGVVGALLLFYSAHWLATHGMGDPRVTPILSTFVLMVPLWNLQKTMLAVFGGFKRPTYKVLVEDLFVPIGLLAVVLLAWWIDWTEIEIAQGYVLVYLLSVALSVILVHTRTPYQAVRRAKPRFFVRKTLGFSLPLAFTDVLAKSTVGLVDILVVGALASTHAVGIFRVASDMAVLISMVLMIFTFMYFPIVSEFAASGDREKWRDTNSRVARWCMLATLPLFATLFFFPGEVIYLIYGADYMEAASVLRILAVGYFGHAIVGFTSLNLLAAGMTGMYFSSFLASFLLNLGGNFLLIPIFGIQGAAVASLVSLWTMNGIALVVMKRRLDLHPFTWFYLRILVLALVIFWIEAQVLSLFKGLPHPILIALFLGSSLASLGLLYRRGYLTDATDIELLRSLRS